MNPKLDDNDADLFREAVRDVKPLAYDAPVVEPPQRPRPVARFTRADRYAVLQESLYADVSDPELASGEELVFAREGIQKIVLRKLRRGQYQVQAEIDLHGLTVAEAKEAVRTFLANALERHFRCVRIIHGKGLRSRAAGPVLKALTDRMLRRRDDVVAFASARPMQGGTGAVVVLLKGR